MDFKARIEDIPLSDHKREWIERKEVVISKEF